MACGRRALCSHAAVPVAAAALLFAIAAAAMAEGQIPQQLIEEHQLRMTYQTPHTDWATPYARGPVKALVFCVGKYERARCCVELMQRFDIQVTPVYFRHNRKVIHFTEANVDRELSENPPGSDGVARLRLLLKRRWDVFIFGNIDPDVLPAELQYYMYRQVADGAGIVCIGPAARVMTPQREIPLPPELWPPRVKFWRLGLARREWFKPDQNPEQAAKGMLHAYKLAKGRGVWFAMPRPLSIEPALTASPEALVELDYWFALAGDLALWAAGKPAVMERGAQVQVRVRTLDGRVVRDWQPAGAELPDKPPEAIVRGLPAGEYYLDAIARRRGRVVSFAATTFTVPPAGPRIAGIRVDTDFAEVGESFSGTISLDKADYSGVAVRLEMKDCWGRILARQELQPPAQGGELRFSIRVPPQATIFTRLQASLWRGGRQLTQPVHVDVRVPRRHRDGFRHIIWDYASTATGYWAVLRLRQLGWDVCLTGHPGASLAMADVPAVVYTTRILEKHDERGIMRPCCWNDEAAVTRWIQSIAQRQVDARKHGVFVYSLGDETTTKGCCLSEHCLRAYRRYLKQVYGSIAALNRSWGISYRSFDEVKLSKPDDNYEKTALQQGNYARWFDRLSFSQRNFLQLCKRFGQRYRQLDPKAVTGFEGAGRFGDDIAGFVRTNGFWNPYPSIVDDILRSIAPRGYISGNWIGYQRDAEPLIYWYWRIILNGRPSVWWWRWDGIGRWHGILAPDFEPFAASADLMNDTRIVREGLGDLLIHTDQAFDPVAIMYSRAAAAADRIPGTADYAKVRQQHDHWAGLLRHAGVNFRYLLEEQIEAGALSDYKLLILPFTRAISDRAAAAIERFVRGGGTLVVDLRPAEFTEHLARRPEPALDRLLGVRHARQGRPTKAALKAEVQLGQRVVKLQARAVTCEAAIELSGARPMAKAGDVPVLLVHRVGRGRAILLNFPISDLGPLGGTEGAAARELVRALVDLAGVRPTISLRESGPQVLLNSAVWRAGDLIVCGVQLRSYSVKGGRFTLTLRRTMHCYDLRSRRYAGARQAFSFPAYRTRFLVFAPQRLRPVSARAEWTGREIRLRLTAPSSPRGLYAAHVAVYDPRGAECLWARRNVVLRSGQRRTMELFPGLEPAAGTWTVVVTDLYTGRRWVSKIAVGR